MGTQSPRVMRGIMILIFSLMLVFMFPSPRQIKPIRQTIIIGEIKDYRAEIKKLELELKEHRKVFAEKNQEIPPQIKSLTEQFKKTKDEKEKKRIRAQAEKLQKELLESQEKIPETRFKIGYCYEFGLREYKRALKEYQKIVPKKRKRGPGFGCQGCVPTQQFISHFEPIAVFRMAEIKQNILHDEKGANQLYESLGGIWKSYPKIIYQIKTPQRNETIKVTEEAGKRSDEINSRKTLYKMLHLLVRVAGNNPKFSHALALILIALIINILLNPISVKQFKLQKEMQKLQPELQKIQKKYKDKPQELMRRQAQLFREHKVNPMSSCLWGIIQLPILWLVWYAIRDYHYQFSKASFLWISNLGEPDSWLVILYAFSMYLTMELTTPPSADPTQAQTQSMMAVMMPLMLVLFFRTFPAAFILYWLAFNIFTTVKQYLTMAKLEGEPIKPKP